MVRGVVFTSSSSGTGTGSGNAPAGTNADSLAEKRRAKFGAVSAVSGGVGKRGRGRGSMRGRGAGRGRGRRGRGRGRGRAPLSKEDLDRELESMNPEDTKRKLDDQLDSYWSKNEEASNKKDEVQENVEEAAKQPEQQEE